MTEPIDILNLMLRGASISIIVLIAILLTRDLKSIQTRLCAALFLYGAVSYLMEPVVSVYLDTPFARTVIYFGSFNAPLFFWLFAQTLFNDSFRFTKTIGVIVGAYLLLGIGLDIGEILPFRIIPETWRDFVFPLRHIWALGFIAHGLFITGIGKEDDLLEPRRRLRTVMVWAIGAYISAILLVEVVIEGTVLDDVPHSHPLNAFNAFGILILSIALAAALTRIHPAFAAQIPTPNEKPRPSSAKVQNPADALAIGQLLDFIEKERGYTTEALTIVKLAEILSIPEHRLRKLINSELGYRNFSDFLNQYRIEAACTELSDPAKARIPILTIAMDLGYQSIGPFNRAFKEKKGLTPSEFRRQSFGSAGPGASSADPATAYEKP